MDLDRHGVLTGPGDASGTDGIQIADDQVGSDPGGQGVIEAGVRGDDEAVTRPGPGQVLARP